MINQLRRDIRAKHYKPLLLLVTLNFLDKQKFFAPIIPAKKIIDEFEIIMKKIGYNKEHNKGWMPFWHLSGDNIWNLFSINHQIVKKTAFKLLKPKTKKQLLSKVNYALINFDKFLNRYILILNFLTVILSEYCDFLLCSFLLICD